MSNKQTGNVIFKMIVKQGLESTETTYETEGTLFIKDNQYFLFYDEASVDDESVTKCRYEFTHDQLRIRRNGNVTLDQTHQIGTNSSGYMKTIYGNLETKVKTHQLSMNVDTDELQLIVDYDLYISGDRTGNYHLIILFNTKEATQ